MFSRNGAKNSSSTWAPCEGKYVLRGPGEHTANTPDGAVQREPRARGGGAGAPLQALGAGANGRRTSGKEWAHEHREPGGGRPPDPGATGTRPTRLPDLLANRLGRHLLRELLRPDGELLGALGHLLRGLLELESSVRQGEVESVTGLDVERLGLGSHHVDLLVDVLGLHRVPPSVLTRCACIGHARCKPAGRGTARASEPQTVRSADGGLQ